MTTRWGHDAEERQNVARKAHDAYAAARQAMDKATGAEASAAAVRAENAELRVLLEAAQRQIGRLQRALDMAQQTLEAHAVSLAELRSAVARPPHVVAETGATRKRKAA